MMKKWLAVLFAAVLLISLVACNGPAGSSDVGGDTSSDRVSTQSGSGSSAGTTDPTTDSDGVTDSTADAGTSSVTDTDSSSGSSASVSTNSSTNGTTDSSSNQNTSSDPDPEPEEFRPVTVVNNLVMASDQVKNRVVLYDITNAGSNRNLDDFEIWSFTPSLSSRSNLSGLKYREDTAFGDVVIMVASGGYAGVVTYPQKQVIWEISSCGNNPHSIEILPGGNVVCAASTGNSVRLYYSSQGNTSAGKKYVEYTLASAHGVLWDPANQCLWALGSNALVRYTLVGSGASQTLSEISRYALPKTGGHDLAADFSDPNFLYLSVGSCVFRFDKTKGTFTSDEAGKTFLNLSNIKGFGNNLNGNYFYAYPNGGPGRPWSKESKASWCTDTIYFACRTDWEAYEIQPFVSASCAFYKVRVFYGRYQ